jgi:recombinational DNA repair ATPase RecF
VRHQKATPKKRRLPMSENVRMIRFEHFRRLPANEFELRGKNLVILGTNGKGKSAVVDGIEFIFS